MRRPAAAESSERETKETGLPFFHTWKSVYLFVLGSFVFWVALLIALTKIFS
jgi:cell division septal protein FtsQ